MTQDPTAIGRFRITRRLGEGGMGVVYAGYDDALQRDVAIARFYTRLGRPDLGLLGFRAAIEQGYFSVPHLDADPIWDPLRAEPAFAEAMALARRRRAVGIFVNEGGPGFLGVETPRP